MVLSRVVCVGLCACVCVCVRVCVCVQTPLLYCARALHAKNIKETLTSNRVIFPTHMFQMYLQYPDAHVQYDGRCAVTGTVKSVLQGRTGNTYYIFSRIYLSMF